MASQLTPMGNPDARKRMKRVGRAVWRASEWADHVISIRERLRQFGIVRLLVSLLSGIGVQTVYDAVGWALMATGAVAALLLILPARGRAKKRPAPDSGTDEPPCRWQHPRPTDDWILAELYLHDILRVSHFIDKEERRHLTQRDRDKIIELANRFEEQYPAAVRVNTSGMHEVNARILRRWIGQAAMKPEKCAAR